MTSPAYVKGGMALAGLLALVAAALVWHGRDGRLYRALMSVACVLGGGAIAYDAVYTARRPSTSPWLALASVGVVVGISALGPWRAGRRASAAASGVMAVGLGALALGTRGAWPGGSTLGVFFGFSEASYVCGAGALLWGAICALAVGEGKGPRLGGAILPVVLLSQTASLVALGLGAQMAWGAYWSWDPIECWRLTSGLVVGMAMVGLGWLGWTGRRVGLALWLAALWTLAVLLGAFPLVRWLGLSSLYLLG